MRLRGQCSCPLGMASLFGAGRMTVGDIWDLAATHNPASTDALKAYYDWVQQASRASSLALFGAALSLLAAVVTSVLKQDFNAADWQVSGVAVGSAFLAGVGAVFLWRLRLLAKEFVVALQLLTLLEAILP